MIESFAVFFLNLAFLQMSVVYSLYQQSYVLVEST